MIFRIASVLFILLLPSFSNASNCLEPIGWGARAVGRGGVEIAIANDCDALNSNPAGIIQIKGKQLDIGVGVFRPKVRFKNRYIRRHTRTQYYPSPEIGFVIHLKEKPMAIGFGIFGNKNKMLGDSKLAVAKAIFGLAYQVHSGLSVGFAFHYYYINYYLASPMGPAYLDADKMHGFGYNTGYMHCRTKMRNFGVPRKLALGVAYRVNKRWLVGIDLEWQQYSRAFNELIVKLSDMKIPSVQLRLPFRFRDTYIFSVGTECMLSRFLTLRFGYSLSTELIISSSQAGEKNA